LFLTFKWNDDDDIFYGIYDFVDSKWKIENDAYNHEMLTDVKSMNEDEIKICQAMTDFLNFIKNGAQPKLDDSPSNQIIISTPIANPVVNPGSVPDPTSDLLLKELLDAKDIYIPVLTKDEVIYIEVKFKDNIPENIEIVAMPTTTAVEPSLKTYIEEICNGTKSVPDGTVVYFKFDQTELTELLGLI
jgi:hypothetical protein